MFVVAATVKLLGLLQQSQAQLDQSGTFGEVVVGRTESFGEALALGFDVAEFGVDFGLGLGHRGICGGGEVDQVVFLDVKGVQLGGELPVQEAGRGFFVGNGRADVGAHFGDEIRGEPDGGVVGFDGVFDPDDVDLDHSR